jgi:hypothetical protein
VALVTVDQACGPALGQLFPYCETIVPASYLPFVAMIVASGVFGFFARRQQWRALIPLFAIASFAVPLRTLAVESLSAHEEAISEAAFVRRLAAIDDGRRIYVFAKLSDIASFAYYFDRPFGMLESVDPEFHFPRRRPEAEGKFLTFRALDTIARAEPVYVVSENWRAGAVPPDNTYVPYCVVLKTRRVSLLSNVPADCRPG